MYYTDTQRSLTRRSSSLLATTMEWDQGFLDSDFQSTPARGDSATHFSESSANLPPKGPVENEIITVLFESMLGCIIDSWEPITPDEGVPHHAVQEKNSVETKSKSTGKKDEKKVVLRRRSRTKSETDSLSHINAPLPKPQCWWASPDERVVIKFKNGNTYEGAVSMKTMHGSGRFQWADGTVYMGAFDHNAMTGRGCIYWKDDTWYSGEFYKNLRHGQGMYVDSRRQRCYVGGWHLAMKHGQGVIYFDGFGNSYDGDWVHNYRHGSGTREYCAKSVYEGEWDHNLRNGKGLMIWANHDFYQGSWKNGVMTDHGVYIWDAHNNNTMSRPVLLYYDGTWENGLRDGFGVLTFGYGFGAYYKGGFHKNSKHGEGKIVTASGQIIRDQHLFTDGNMNALHCSRSRSFKLMDEPLVPFRFDMCDKKSGLSVHIIHALRNMNRQEEIRVETLAKYFTNNVNEEINQKQLTELMNKKNEYLQSKCYIQDFMNFEERSLSNALECYAKELENIYYGYATICNDEPITFTPILIRLYLWQLYYDIDIHQKGLTLFQIDQAFARTPEWLAQSPHNPFERIYYWQFVNSLVCVACMLYCERTLPTDKSNSVTAIVSGAFRKFMDLDVLPLALSRKGKLVTSYGRYIPLRAAYHLYQSIGEAHTVREFLYAVRRSPHLRHARRPSMVTPDSLLNGRNLYEIGDEMKYITEEESIMPLLVDTDDTPYYVVEEDEVQSTMYEDLKLFNFGNLSSRNIIDLFARIFPKIVNGACIMDLDVCMTFFEFFQVFVTCAEKSILVKDEEKVWREKFSPPCYHKADMKKL